MFQSLQIRQGLVGLGLFAAIATVPAVHAADLHVPADFPTITIAINNAVNGDVIVVAPGIYAEALNFGTKRISLISSGGPEVTTINAFQLQSVIRITGGGGTVSDRLIDGFTLTGGRAYRGGGLSISNASATVRNCLFLANEATLSSGGDLGDGGGIYAEIGTLILEDCAFVDNGCSELGGGAYFRHGTTVTANRCHFEGNVAPHGAGLAGRETNLTLHDCTFLLNGTVQLTEIGGGILAWDSTVTADRCRFEANMINDDGSAILARTGATVTLRNSVFVGNIASGGSTPTAAVYSLDAGTSVVMQHCTMVGNSSAGTSALRAFGGTIQFRNGIVWGNAGSGPISAGSGGSVSITYSLVQGGYAGAGNISNNPMLDADLRPLPGSPTIDAGNSTVLAGPDPRDFDDNPRAVNDPATAITGVPIYGLTVDMGAFEFQPVNEGSKPTCPGDLNGDGVIDGADLGLLLSLWGSVCIP